MIRTLAEISENTAYDFIILGSGAAGMAAALFAGLAKQRVLLIERTEYLGGTSALSAATTWIPNSHHASKVSEGDSLEIVSKFLDQVVGNHSDAAVRQAFLQAAPKAIAKLEAESAVKFRPYATHPDYEQLAEGATMRGRALEPVPFDGRVLGADLKAIRPPIPEFTIFGGMMVDRTDIGHLLNLKKNKASFLHAMKILSAYGRDRLTGNKRGARLVMGNALIGRMLRSLQDCGVDIVLNTSVTALEKSGTGYALAAKNNGLVRNFSASKGVILAAGGYSRHKTRRIEMLGAVPKPEHSPAAPGATGEAQDLALKLGARFGEGAADHAFWAPVSIRKRADGSLASFPHFVMDRSKPGTVCVNQQGLRFTNESSSYHLFGRAMQEADKLSPTIPCYIITDAPRLKKYGLGMVRMGTKNLAPFLADGYLVEGKTIAELAAKLNIPAENLEKTIAAMNSYAKTGVDPEFGRGTTPYHRVNGDEGAGTPNPTMGEIATVPFYAVRLYPADIGAATGLAINPNAEVLGKDNMPIGGLYACGNEAQSVMGGTYPGPGITIGPAITFAYIAIEHALSTCVGRETMG